jgi:hypothetical protein
MKPSCHALALFRGQVVAPFLAILLFSHVGRGDPPPAQKTDGARAGTAVRLISSRTYDGGAFRRGKVVVEFEGDKDAATRITNSVVRGSFARQLRHRLAVWSLPTPLEVSLSSSAKGTHQLTITDRRPRLFGFGPFLDGPEDANRDLRQLRHTAQDSIMGR